MPNCPECNTPMETDARFCSECRYDAKPPRPQETFSKMRTQPRSKESVDTTNDLEPGSKFADRYLIENIIGRGGMGVVYRARDTLADKIVALKLIRPDLADGEEAMRRLIAEGTIARDIRHKNVIAVYDVGQVDGQPFVSMEFLDHPSLETWHYEKNLSRETVSLRIATRIIAEIMDGLKAAHEAGIIHRDLKPANIILIGEPTEKSAPLKILDFGIASAMKIPTTGTTGPGTDMGTGIGGTPGYMASEQYTKVGAITPATDIYAASVMFYQLLMDALPIGHWQPPSGGRSDVSIAIDELIQTGLSNHAASRQQSAVEYREQLVNAINHPRRLVNRGAAKDANRKSSTDKNNGSSALKWGGGIAAGLCALFVLSAIPENEGAPPIPEVHARDNQTQQILDAEASNEQTRPPPPPVNPYADISGTWIWADGSSNSVQVNRNGTFSYNWPDSNVRGQFQGTAGEFVQTAFNQPLVFSGIMERVDQCHLDFVAFAPNGAQVSAGKIHINHQPGAPCP